MSKMFDLLSGETSGPVAEAEARAEYSEGILGSVLEENEKLRAALKKICELRGEADLIDAQRIADRALRAFEQTSVRAEK